MNEKVRVLLVEDEYLTRQALVDILEEVDYEISGEAISAQEAIKVLEQETTDIVLLDINIKGDKDGIWVGKQIQEKYHIPFIYLTANGDRQTLNRGIETNPHAYLLKPFNESNLFSAIELALKKFSAEKEIETDEEEMTVKIKDAIFVRDGHAFQKIVLSSILYISSDKNYLDIVTAQKTHVVRSTLKDMLVFLETDFIQIHRSYVVNLNYVERFSNAIVTINKVQLPLGKSYQQRFLKQFNKLGLA